MEHTHTYTHWDYSVITYYGDYGGDRLSQRVSQSETSRVNNGRHNSAENRTVNFTYILWKRVS